MIKRVHLSPEGHRKLKDKLKYLKSVRRRELSQEIAVARAHGDLKENAEYDSAKQAQGLNEAMVAKIETQLSQAQILDESKIAKDEALIGATVKLKNVDNGAELSYTLVSELEADFAEGKISITSPVGKGLLGHKKNAVVKITVPAGVLKYKILKISRD